MAHKIQKRNRKQRQSADVYRVEHLFKDGAPHPIDQQRRSFIEGNLDAVLIVSVPTSTPVGVCDQLQKTVADKFKQDVLVITHNIEFMKATKVPPNEAARIVGQAEETEKVLQ